MKRIFLQSVKLDILLHFVNIWLKSFLIHRVDIFSDGLIYPSSNMCGCHTNMSNSFSKILKQLWKITMAKMIPIMLSTFFSLSTHSQNEIGSLFGPNDCKNIRAWVLTAARKIIFEVKNFWNSSRIYLEAQVVWRNFTTNMPFTINRDFSLTIALFSLF